MRLFRNSVLSIVSAAAVAALLAGCSTGDAPEPTSPTATTAAAVDACEAKAGSASDSVSVTGDFGVTPTVTFDPGITADVTQRTELVSGTGPQMAAGQTAIVAFAIYDGTTGSLVQTAGFDGASPAVISVDTSQYIVGLVKTIGCATTGSRVVSVVPASEGFGDTGQPNLGIAAGDSLVMVMDVLPVQATGVDQPAVDGLPAVTLAADGAPTIAIPSTDAPAELQVAVLKKGAGAPVADGSTVLVQYQGVKWSTGEVFDQTWGEGPTTLSMANVVPGFSQGLVGQTTGSQVLIVVPPALGYGEAGSSTNELAGEPLVFLIDILAVG